MTKYQKINYKSQTSNFKQILNFNVQNYKQIQIRKV